MSDKHFNQNTSDMGIIKKHGIASQVELEKMLYMQTVELSTATCLFMDEEARGQVLDITMACIYKLGAIKYHHDRFLDEWNKRFDEIDKQTNQNTIVEESVLAYELEAFVFQIKSSLDALVKILKPLVGEELTTFGEYGNKVIKVLKGNLKDAFKPRAEKLIAIIQYHQEMWIKGLVTLRDKLTHHKGKTRGLQNFFFVKTDTPGSLKAPKLFGGGDARSLIENGWNNIQIFMIDFIAHALYIYIPDALELVYSGEKGKIGRYVIVMKEPGISEKKTE